MEGLDASPDNHLPLQQSLDIPLVLGNNSPSSLLLPLPHRLRAHTLLPPKRRLLLPARSQRADPHKSITSNPLLRNAHPLAALLLHAALNVLVPRRLRHLGNRPWSEQEQADADLQNHRLRHPRPHVHHHPRPPRNLRPPPRPDLQNLLRRPRLLRLPRADRRVRRLRRHAERSPLPLAQRHPLLRATPRQIRRNPPRLVPPPQNRNNSPRSPRPPLLLVQSPPTLQASQRLGVLAIGPRPHPHPLLHHPAKLPPLTAKLPLRGFRLARQILGGNVHDAEPHLARGGSGIRLTDRLFPRRWDVAER